MSSKKRTIRISRNSLDPLSRWYNSLKRVGDINGNKLENPASEDRRIRIQRRGGGENTNWKISSPNRNGQAADLASQYINIKNFVEAALANEQIMPLEIMWGVDQNPFIYKEDMAFGVNNNQPVFRSMAADMLSNYLDTYEALLPIMLSPGPIANLLNAITITAQSEDPRFTNFLRSIPGQVNPDAEVVFKTIVNTVKGDFFDEVTQGQVQQRTIVDLVVQSLTEFAQTLGDDQEANTRSAKLVAFLITKDLVRIVNNDELITAAVSRAIRLTQTYKHDYVEIETPYVSTRNSSIYLDEISSGSPFRATVNPDYSYFVRGYEKNTDTDSVPELLLPNTYVKRYLQKLSVERRAGNLTQEEERDLENPGSLHPNKFRKFTEFSSIIGLEGTIKPEVFESVYEDVYYTTYGALIGNASLSDEQFFALETKNRAILIDGPEINDGALNGGFPPMNIGVTFTRDQTGAYQRFINSDVDIFDAMSVVFENIEYGDNNTQQYLFSTDYLLKSGEVIQETQSPPVVADLRTYTLESLYAAPHGGEGDQYQFRSLFLVTDDHRKPTVFDYQLGMQALELEADRVCEQSFSKILNAQDSISEPLGYRIRKDVVRLPDAGQNFYLGNGSGDKVLTYKDAQIKYGDEYNYSLYEYRIVYSTVYTFGIFNSDIPVWLIKNFLGIRTDATAQLQHIQRQLINNRVPPSMNWSFDIRSVEYPSPSIIEVPIYDKDFNDQTIFNVINDGSLSPDILLATTSGGKGSISYPTVKVMDRPPTAPVLTMFPLFGIKDQFKMNINLQTGASLGDAARDIVSIGDTRPKILELKEYQDNFINRFLPPGKMEYKNEGLAELRNIIVYRTTDINLEVDSYNDIYKSFNPETNPNVLVRRFTDKPIDPEGIQATQVLSYDLLESIEPNVNYYYTCVVEDFHGNPSNPSIIYRIRILFDKGLSIPEIDTVVPVGSSTKAATKDLARFLQIDASNIQSFPYFDSTQDDLVSYRSLGSLLGNSLEEQSYILRLTSKDTGRKFDIKLNFVVNVDGSPINVGT